MVGFVYSLHMQSDLNPKKKVYPFSGDGVLLSPTVDAATTTASSGLEDLNAAATTASDNPGLAETAVPLAPASSARPDRGSGCCYHDSIRQSWSCRSLRFPIQTPPSQVPESRPTG